MALPEPIPDNPLRWEGWKNFQSPNFYERLCLSEGARATNEQIEENCRRLLVWWQKKLPLKNQPSNPLAQLLRGGLEEAPVLLAEARAELLNPERRARLDAALEGAAQESASRELRKWLSFAVVNQVLTTDAESRIARAAEELGVSAEAFQRSLEAELQRMGARRMAPDESSLAGMSTSETSPGTPADEFRKTLQLSRLCQGGGEMSDDQRDALCNIGEGLGLTGGQAEDLIDEYLGQMADASCSGSPKTVLNEKGGSSVRSRDVLPRVPTAQPGSVAGEVPRRVATGVHPVDAGFRQPDFRNSLGCEMIWLPGGRFTMGSDAPDALDNERPLTPVVLACFFLGRFPITNAQFEQCDPAHRAFRPPWAGDNHPVVSVSATDAARFCGWLSQREGRKYRLPTEAEWEYAARGTDGRVFPWGDRLDAGYYANFADCRTSFPWRDPQIDDGYAQGAPVGCYPRGGSPFGIEDLSGNVFEWCLDDFEAYKGRERVNPRGAQEGSKRVYRGGSWKSRAHSLRASARHFNAPSYSSNDVGFRVVCECAPAKPG
jgi:formylglycine-generating enzyme required for sulfatase activity